MGKTLGLPTNVGRLNNNNTHISMPPQDCNFRSGGRGGQITSSFVVLSQVKF